MGWETTKPVVVPIDFSGMSVTAIDAALKAAAGPELVHVVHVVPTLDQVVPDVEEWGIPGDEEREASVRSHFTEFLRNHGFKHLRQVVLDGRPGPQVAEYAEKIGAGLIVIPSHGFHGLKRWFLGSVAEQVTRLAKCPVLVMRRDDAE